MKRVFVSHPYSDNPEFNKIKVDKICKRLLREGVLPISPIHLFAFMDGDKGIRPDIMEICYRLIDISNEVRVYGDCPGTQDEVRYAWKTGKPVIDCTVQNWDGYMRERSEITYRG